MAALASLFVEFRASTSAFASDMRDISKEVNAFNRDLKPTTDRLKDFGKVATSVGQGLTAAVSLPLIGIGVVATKAAADFESSFAGVRKTVDATEAEFAQLSQQFRDMAKTIPVSVNELNKIGEAAGQIGIKKENIVGFTRVMADLATTTNLTSDQAATSLARLANITKMPQDAFDRLGATVVALGNAGASTESEIVEFGLRIAGAGAQVGLTEAQILSFGSALASVGINAEAGGTAISKVFIEIASAAASGGKKLEQFAAVAGMSAADFKKAFKDDAAGATVSFVEGLGKISKEGGNVFGVLDEMGLSEVRVRDAMLRASGAGDLLRESIKTGTEAWKANTALTDEAAKRYKTFDSQLQLFKNQLNDVAITLGTAMLPAFTSILENAKPLIAILGKVADAFAALPTSVQTFIIALAGIGIAIGPVLLGLGLAATGFANLLPAITGVVTVLKSVQVIQGFGAALSALPLFAAVKNVGDLRAAISLLGETSLIAKLGLVGLAAGVGIAIGMFINWIVKITGLQDALDKLIKRAVELIPVFGKWATGQNEVDKATQGTTDATKKMVEALAKRNIKVDESRLTDAKYIAELGQQVKAQTTAEQAAKAHANATVNVGNAMKDAGPDAAALAKMLSGTKDKHSEAATAAKQQAEALANLKEQFTNSLAPANALNVDLDKLAKMGFSTSQIVAVYGDAILKAAGSQREHGIAITGATQKLEPYALGLLHVKDAAENLKKSQDEMKQTLKSSGVELKNVEVSAEAAAAAMKLAWANFGGPKAKQALDSMRDMGQETQDTAKAVDALAKKGYTTDQIMYLLGNDIKKAAEHAKVFGGNLTPLEKKLLATAEATEKAAQRAKEFSQAWANAMANLTTRIAEGLADVIVNGGKFGEKMEAIAKDTAQGMLSAFISGLISPLTDAFAELGAFAAKQLVKLASFVADKVLDIGASVTDKITNLFNRGADTTIRGAANAGVSAAEGFTGPTLGMLGGTGAQTAGAAGGIGSAGGGVSGAASGAMGTVGAIGAVGSALAGIGGIFQMKRLEGTMNAVEENTRYTQIQLKDTMEQILWPQFNLVNWIALQSNAIVAQLGSIYETLSTPDRSSSGVAVPSVAAQNQAVAAPNITVTYGDINITTAPNGSISELIEKLKRALQTNQDGLAAEIIKTFMNQAQGQVARG